MCSFSVASLRFAAQALSGHLSNRDGVDILDDHEVT